ncbi:TPA: restriction endonuclease subunit S [Pseudomonas aeruginosa]|jgi:type I restriction enzyme S subunit|nr:restriction endonuclease subunit S [Pseudomonas aeruginosa]
MKWPQKKLGQVADFLLGKMLDEKKNKGEFRPYLANVNVRWGSFELGSLREMRFELHEHERYGLQFGDIVMCEGGEPGRCAIWKNQVPGMMFQKALHRIRPKAEMDVRFLYYSFLNRGKNGGFDQYCTGSTIKHLPRQNLAMVEVDVPPLTIQKQIASILSAYDDLIENNTRRIEILEEMARRLYEEWFVQFRFPGHEGVEFKESELGLIPEGWDLTTVAETFEILGGGTPSKSEPAYWEGGQINWYSPTDLTRSGTAFMDESGTKITDIGLSRSSAKMFPPYSVMLTSRATIGVVAINTTPATTNQGFITCIPNKRFPLYLLFHWIKNNVDRFISLGTGATFKEITKGVFKGIELVVPPAALVDDFQQKVAPLMDMILRLQRKNRNLRTQRDLLLPKLISGEIDVSDIPMPT